MKDGIEGNNEPLTVRPKIGIGSPVPLATAEQPTDPASGGRLFNRIMPQQYITNALVRELAISTCGTLVGDMVGSIRRTMGLSAEDAAAVLDRLAHAQRAQQATDELPPV
jgi:hypothetical protein